MDKLKVKAPYPPLVRGMEGGSAKPQAGVTLTKGEASSMLAQFFANKGRK